jgi:hypothetical protein
VIKNRFYSKTIAYWFNNTKFAAFSPSIADEVMPPE